MAASYTLIGHEPTIQVVTPTLTLSVEECTIQTTKSGIIASILVLESEFNAGTEGPLLTAFADGIETIVGRGHVLGGTGSQSFDVNGLQQWFVTFTVGYTPPGSPYPPLTADADVPVGLLSQSDPTIASVNLGQAEAIVDAAYNNLVKATEG